MPRTNTFTEIAKRAGKTPEQLAVESMQLHHTELKAAQALGVYPNTIRYWRKKAQDALTVEAQQK